MIILYYEFVDIVLDLINKVQNDESLCASVDFLDNNIIRKDTVLTNVIYWTLNFNINQ